MPRRGRSSALDDLALTFGVPTAMRCFVTGTAGFIGFHVAKRLLDSGATVVGFDGLTPYYDVALKQARHRVLAAHPAFLVAEGMLEDAATLRSAFDKAEPDVVIHLAAQAGVRYSLENPRAYVEANFVGTFNLLECCRGNAPRHLLMASTSSAYGGNQTMPFRESDPVAWPLTLYAASKIGTEVMAHAYAHLWGLPTTVFRFFTVYGPWGRPDMALFKFTKSILENEPIEIYNNGRSTRDFTYVDDLVESIVRLIPLPPGPEKASARHDTLSPVAPHRVVNIGGGNPVSLLAFVDEIERTLGQAAQRVYCPIPAGDVAHTTASPDLLRDLTGFVPNTPISVGIPAFIRWYRSYYGRESTPMTWPSPAATCEPAFSTPSPNRPEAAWQ